MQQKKLYAPIKYVSYAVLVLMGSAIVYAFSIAILYWTGIGV